MKRNIDELIKNMSSEKEVEKAEEAHNEYEENGSIQVMKLLVAHNPQMKNKLRVNKSIIEVNHHVKHM